MWVNKPVPVWMLLFAVFILMLFRGSYSRLVAVDGEYTLAGFVAQANQNGQTFYMPFFVKR